ncbi:CoA ester lyase [Deinococcus sp. KSM4-11]|uniref:HpcH/HpaI aldolase/citrate lyase family protein n=1 Tax=Deinococcus sp. KSM4-11 TaxID=2568654 RepID=UPI001454D1AD|nr:CoA ester lyase [Deinococcus sp. KSM4-11]
MLFVPGSDERKLAKIGTLGAEALLLDLEDGVAPSAKALAREQVARSLQSAPPGLHVWVRVNAADSPDLYDDLHAVIQPGVEGINLPKVESPDELRRVDWLIGELERRRGVAPGGIQLMATLETVRGVRAADAIAAASPRVVGLCFGAADYSRDLGLAWPPPDGQLSLAVLHAKVALVEASALAGLEPPHDGASGNFRDLERLRSEAEAARALGFSGKHAIHPAQLPVIEDVFAPSAAELEWARRVSEGYEVHAAEGTGAFALEGTMVDAPVAARARALLRRALRQASR